MREFDYTKLSAKTYDTETLNLITRIYEYKGKQELYTRQNPVELTHLVEVAKIQSIEASNQIEGIVTTTARLKQLYQEKTTPKNRDEKEILGYRNCLNIIHRNYNQIPLTPNYILQLHGELLKYTSLSYGGRFKNTENQIVAQLANGETRVLFEPVSAFETPEAVEKICAAFNYAVKTESVDPLILIANFILDFLCIHPFNDGNGRMSRLLTLLLLYKSGFVVGQYISVEKAIADTKESYYENLRLSDKDWHTNQNDISHFVKYMLAILLSCYKEFDRRINFAWENGIKSTSYEIVKKYAAQKIGAFTKQDALVSCPKLKSSSVESALKKLCDEGFLQKLGAGKNTKYARSVDADSGE